MGRPPKMYFVVNGAYEYFLMSGHQVAVRAGSWISEPVLWTDWTHKGGLRAKGDSHLCELLADAFQQVCVEFNHTFFDPQNYGIRFLALLNAREGNLSDLPLPREELEEATNYSRSASFYQESGPSGGGVVRVGFASCPRNTDFSQTW